MGKSMASSGDKHKEEAEKIRALIAQHLQDAQKLLSPLEDYVMFQVKNNCYDFDANRHLLRSYLLYPDTIKIDILGKMLMKMLMALPNTHFLAASYMLPEKLHSLEPVKTLFKLANLLETTQFKKFWQETSDSQTRQLLDTVPGFDDAIRVFIAGTVMATFQSISVGMCKDMLNLASAADKKALADRVAVFGWKLSDDGASVEFPNRKAPAAAAAAPAAAAGASAAASSSSTSSSSSSTAAAAEEKKAAAVSAASKKGANENITLTQIAKILF